MCSVSLLHAIACCFGTLQVISVHSIEINKLRMHPVKWRNQPINFISSCNGFFFFFWKTRMPELRYGIKSGELHFESSYKVISKSVYYFLSHPIIWSAFYFTKRYLNWSFNWSFVHCRKMRRLLFISTDSPISPCINILFLILHRDTILKQHYVSHSWTTTCLH